MMKLLLQLGACEDAKIWAKGKTWPEIYNSCDRGDWLLWLFKITNNEDLKLLTLAKGHCANTVRHLMKDPRSLAATDAAIAFGNGEIDRAALDLLFKNAYAAYAAYASDYAAYASDYAAYAAAAAAAYAAAVAYVAAAAAAAAYAADAAADDAADNLWLSARNQARKENRLLTADIVRKYIPIELWNISESGELINK